MSKKYPPQQSGTLDASQDVVGSWQLHIPVLLDATLDLLQPKKDESYLDLTTGYGGHTEQVIAATEAPSRAVLVDRDEHAIHFLEKFSLMGARLIHQDFASAAQILADEGKTFDMILIDLGVSSPQLDNKERGFSFKQTADLDMRMDQRLDLTAQDVVNSSSQELLARIIREYGEESARSAQRIAQAIVRSRPLKTTIELAEVIKKQHRGKWSKIHPATRTFQALRMHLNDELGQIRAVLPLLPKLLNSGGRVAVISFHSLEDALVKAYFKEQATAGYEASLALLNKKPISGAIEDVNNPRARSAKLRGAVKIKTT